MGWLSGCQLWASYQVQESAICGFFVWFYSSVTISWCAMGSFIVSSEVEMNSSSVLEVRSISLSSSGLMVISSYNVRSNEVCCY